MEPAHPTYGKTSLHMLPFWKRVVIECVVLVVGLNEIVNDGTGFPKCNSCV